jgi:hypothetical protein
MTEWWCPRRARRWHYKTVSEHVKRLQKVINISQGYLGKITSGGIAIERPDDKERKYGHSKKKKKTKKKACSGRTVCQIW